MAKASGNASVARCVCGKVRMEIGLPAVWAWHDHGSASRLAQGCAYATYVGSWRSKFRFLRGARSITRYEDAKAGTIRSFCAACGTPVLYERARAPKMVNIPRALFATRTGREPRYHLNLPEAPEWAYDGGALVPLRGYPGVMIQRPRRRRSAAPRPGEERT
jgi:hypothetical protein